MRTRRLPEAEEFSQKAREAHANGLGPKAPARGPLRWKFLLLRQLAVLLGLAQIFDPPAVRHDLLYALGGTEDDRAFVDAVFFGELMACARAQRGTLRRAVARALAFAVYDLAREFGAQLPHGSGWRLRPEPLTVAQLEKAGGRAD